jgi:acylphosphatase
MPAVSLTRSRVLISGEVQGVGFRYRCRRMANEAPVSGWCRNLPDGRVEACFEGAPDAVGRAVEWCRHGPPGAVVTGVEEFVEPAQGETGFWLG